MKHSVEGWEIDDYDYKWLPDASYKDYYAINVHNNTETGIEIEAISYIESTSIVFIPLEVMKQLMAHIETWVKQHGV